MAVYRINGSELNAVYDINGESLNAAYDIEGNDVFGGEPVVDPMTWDMSQTYKDQVLGALNDISTYQANNEGSYSICQFNDVHETFDGNEPNFIDYNGGYNIVSRMLFLGDIINSSASTEGGFSGATTYMTGASASKRIVGIGNHEYYYYNNSKPSPELAFKPLSNVSRTFLDENYLIFYNDDNSHNVRYIVLNYFWKSKSGGDSAHVIDDAQLNWCASAMLTAGTKDIIICAHSTMNPFYFCNTSEEKSSSATLQNQQNLIDLINAYIDRDTYTITIDGTTYTYDYSTITGKFIMYTSGHYHALGHNDYGFNMFTCPSLERAYGTGQYTGFTFYIIDPAQQKIKVIGIRKTYDTPLSYEFTY